MDISFRTISIYADLENNLIIVPCAEAEGNVIRELDEYYTLSYPYADDQLETILYEALKISFSKKADNANKKTVLEQCMNVNGFVKAMKNQRMVKVKWLSKTGYIVVPTANKGKYGFIFNEEKQILLGNDPKEGDLSQAFRKALSESQSGSK